MRESPYYISFFTIALRAIIPLIVLASASESRPDTFTAVGIQTCSHALIAVMENETTAYPKSVQKS